MELRPIKTEADYDDALAELDRLMDRDDDKATAKIEVLGMLIKAYEDQHYPMELPSALAAIRFTMDQKGLSPKDLIRAIGSRSKVSEILSGSRPLSLAMIVGLHRLFQIPLEALVKDLKIDRKPRGAAVAKRSPAFRRRKAARRKT